MYFGRKPPVRYICPFCYKNIDMKKLHYMCPNPECSSGFVNACGPSERARYVTKAPPFKEIDYEKSMFLNKDPAGADAVFAEGHIVRSSRGGVCDICRNKVSTALCPMCHGVLPPECAYGTSIICFVGAAGTGKSHVMAMMMRDLADTVGPEFGFRISPASEASRTKAVEKYVNRLYVERTVIPSTKPYSGSTEEEKAPMMFFAGKPINRAVAFMDTSGTDLEVGKNLNIYNISSYIGGATGLVFTVDPTRIPDIAARMGFPKPAKYNPVEDLRKVRDIVYSTNQMKPGKSIDIPLAIVLTKVDLLLGTSNDKEQDEVMFGPESSLHLERAKGKYDAETTANIGAEVEEYLRRVLGDEFINTVEGFDRHEYFAVSSLGGEPLPNGRINDLGPFKTEDPLIWLLLRD